MATGKRYYWIKLKDSFMSSDEIDYLMSQPDGANYVVLYQMLCLKTINTNGCLVSKIGEMLIPYDAEKIQRECKWFPLSTVRLALTVYKQIGLIFENPDGTLSISDYQNMIGSETDWAAKNRRIRKVDNEELRNKLVFANEQGWQWAAIEMVASYGMAVGREVFDTVLWIGRFYEALSIQMAQKPRLLCRIEEKRHICHDSRANDPAIRRALIDRFATHDLKNGKGTSKNPDFFYGFKADIWAAYAVGLTAIENHSNDYKISSDC